MSSRRRIQEVRKTLTKDRIIIGIEDMVLLQDVRDVGIVENLKDRLSASQIYTFIGHVLVVCNPYKWLSIYEEATMKQYIHQSRVDVAPHIFATAEAAFRSMVTEEDNQCVIISGESGAGKTEASKQIQAYVAAVSGGGESVEKIKKGFLESNPVLEAFGNAKTLRNNNSSRFGKYFELKFNRFGIPQGGVITNYLLEKSRICRPGDNERNFHIFYQLAASKFAANLDLESVNSFEFLNRSNCFVVDGMNDSEEFEITLSAMRSVGITNNQIQAILTIVAAILHIGNIKFTPVQVDGVEGSTLTRSPALGTFCRLMKLEEAAVVKALTLRTLQTMAPGGKIDTYEVPQNVAQAMLRRDAVAKALYERLFDLVVSRINVGLDPSRQDSSLVVDDLLSIGVLDIYGFEIFTNNGFEQLCINYVNEKLQQIFIELTLRAEQDEYAKEGIAWEPIPFFNNRIVCELLDGVRPPGVFRALDDTCKTMHGTKDSLSVDKKFLETCQQLHGSHAHFHQHASSFTIRHYAGEVSYVAGKFSEANRDALNKDLVLLLKSSEDKLTQHMFPEEVDWDDKKQPVTAGSKIRTQSQALVNTLMLCSPHYVRCVKSNDLKQALKIDQARVQHQVKYLGLSENIKVRRAGFAYRAEYHRFLERFGILSPSTYPEWTGSDKEGCKQIIKAIAKKIEGLSKDEAQLGATKVFIRQPETYFAIERLREYRIGDFAAVIQKAYRRYRSRRVFVVYQNNMAALYSQEHKSRRRDSIYRPYQGDYLDSLAADSVEHIRQAIFRIIDFYDNTENIVFADHTCRQLIDTSAMTADLDLQRQGWHDQPVVLVMTNAAIYVMEIISEAKWQNMLTAQGLPVTKAMPSPVFLRRRVEMAVLVGVKLSKFADGCLVLSVKQPAAALLAGNKDNWLEDSKAPQCQATSTPFTLFTRRHHCRGTGNIFIDAVVNFRHTLPDLGWYQPVRVCDSHIGLSSIDMLEDIVMITPRKSEVISLLMVEWKKCHISNQLPVTFNNSISLHRSVVPALSRLPAPVTEIVFTEHSTATATATKTDEFKATIQGTKITVVCPAGLSHEVVEDRRKRQAARQRKAEQRRRKVEQERRERSSLREADRERDRLLRLEEKKQRKAAEREARREAESAESQKVTKRVSVSGKKFEAPVLGGAKTTKAAPAVGGAGTELAMAMARRRGVTNE